MFYVSKIYSINEPVDVTDSFTWETKKFSFEELKTAVASGTVIKGVSLAGKGLKVSEVTRVSEAKKLLAKYKLIVESDDLDGCDTGVYSGDTFGKG